MWFLKSASFNHRVRWVRWLQAKRCSRIKPLGEYKTLGPSRQTHEGRGGEGGQVCKSYTYFCLSHVTPEMGGICAHYARKNCWNYAGSHEVKEPFSHYTSDMYCVPCSSCQCLERSQVDCGSFSTSPDELKEECHRSLLSHQCKKKKKKKKSLTSGNFTWVSGMTGLNSKHICIKTALTNSCHQTRLRLSATHQDC